MPLMDSDVDVEIVASSDMIIDLTDLLVKDSCLMDSDYSADLLVDLVEIQGEDSGSTYDLPEGSECLGPGTVTIWNISGTCAGDLEFPCSTDEPVKITNTQDVPLIPGAPIAFLKFSADGLAQETTYDVELEVFSGTSLPFVIGDIVNLVLVTPMDCWWPSNHVKITGITGELLLEVYSGDIDCSPWPTTGSSCAPPMPYGTCGDIWTPKMLHVGVGETAMGLEQGKSAIVSVGTESFGAQCGFCVDMGNCSYPGDSPPTHCTGALVKLLD